MLKFSYPFFFYVGFAFQSLQLFCTLYARYNSIRNFCIWHRTSNKHCFILVYVWKKWNKCNTDFSFIVLHIGLTYIMRRLISCKNEEKCQSENQVSANVKLFRRIYAETATEMAGNTEKPVRLPDSIFTLPPEEGTKKHVSGTEFRVSAT